MNYALRTPDDIRRLFSALSDDLTHENLSLTAVDAEALAPPEDDGLLTSLGISLLIAVAAGWTAVKGYERNMGSVPWGVTWGVTGFLFPVPAIVYTAIQSR
jgi:hypothetical protein